MRSDKGTYILVFRSNQPVSVQVGRWGRLELQSAYYLYVGSAFGPGGIRARVGRHAKTDKSCHWHIDYLRNALQLQAAWVSYSGTRKEHAWASLLSASGSYTAIDGFGCSDCRCVSHLFTSVTAPDPDWFRQTSHDNIELYEFC